MPSGRDVDVIVVGAGAAGLAAALSLAGAGREVQLLEQDPAPGGNLRAHQQDGARLAFGPQAVPRSAEHAWWLIERAGLSAEVAAPAGGSARHVYRGGRLHRLPTGPGAFASSSLLSASGKLRLLSEPFRSAPASAPSQESVRSFFSRRLGHEAVEALVAPFVTGIHAADPDALEAASAFPTLVEWERRHGSLMAGGLRAAFARRGARSRAEQGGASGPGNASPAPRPRASLYSLHGGLAALARRCGDMLGARLCTGVATLGLAREGQGWRVLTTAGERTCRAVILAVPPHRAAALLAPALPEAARLAAAVPMAPVAVVHLGGAPAASDRTSCPAGFGVLIARGEGLRSLGTVFTSSLFPDAAPEGWWLQATYVGGALDPSALDLSDEALRALVATETRRVLGIDPDRGLARVLRHPAGIPQMTFGHAARIQALREELARSGGVQVAGNWLDGIGVDAAIRSGRRAAEAA